MAILVTGGTKGIGRDIALAFADPGNVVIVNYHADTAAAEATAADIEAKSAKAVVVRADAGTPEGCAAIAEAARSATDRLDQVVHCAVDVLTGPVLEADPRRFADAVTTNGTSLLFLYQAVSDMLGRGSTLFFLSSRGGRIVVDNYAAIGVGKALAEALLRYMAVELAPKGIRINAIAPSMVDTAAVRSLFGDSTDGLMDRAAAANPSGRNVAPGDYTSLIRYLASPEAEYLTGQVYFINGGSNLSA